jgi:SPP1 family predicted phage head-tail adaptor
VIGKFDQRAALLKKLQTADGGGGFAESWTTFAAVWVSLQTQSGSEVYAGDVVAAKQRSRITLRRRGDVVAGQRVQIGTRLFAILAIEDSGPRTTTLTLSCEEIP